MPRFSVGDTAVIRADLENGQEYGYYFVTEAMARMAGRSVTISAVHEDGSYYIAEDVHNYYWSDGMFYKLDEPTLYHPGDVVLVKDDLEIGREYQMLSGPGAGITDSVIESMAVFAGGAVTIAIITSNGKYKIVDDDMGANWTDEMFSGYASDIEPSSEEEMFAFLGTMFPSNRR